MSDSPEDRERVKARIGAAILEFYRGRRKRPYFFADDLRKYVAERVNRFAPASPDRILRALRREGLLDYTVIDRSVSAYQFHYEDT